MSDLATVDQALLELAEGFNRDAEQWGLSEQEFFLKTLGELDAVEAIAKKNYEKILRQVSARRKGLWYWRGAEFEQLVAQDIKTQPGKKKSFTYSTGTAGYRKVGGKETVVVFDEVAAIANAKDACPYVVKTETSLRKTELLRYMQRTGEELPGTRLETTPAEERFYPKRDMPLLEKEQHNEDV
jgi:hypothetical protein